MVETPKFEYGEEPVFISKIVYCAKCKSEMKSIRKGEFICEKCGEKFIEKEEE